jgi:glycerol-3-phosphate dehydrogenase
VNPDQQSQEFDLLVVGGGVNGAGIARDAAGRGLRVLMCEQDDLAAHTSSASTKLIHGGLRYLEHYEFSLVRKALQEREVLLRSAPHIMWPLRFVMPHDPSMRPAWMIRLGLLLYDHLARREVLPGSAALDLSHHPAGIPLKSSFTRGFIYSDGWVDDARLVVLCALDAAERGARILTRTRCVEARRLDGRWQVRLRRADGTEVAVRARALVNAAGPWAERFLTQAVSLRAARSLRLIKGSHIVVPRLYEHDMAYIFQNPDKRIVFAIPYESEFTLVGTTDVEHTGEPGAVQTSADEVRYLCEMINRYFRKPISSADVRWRYAGVRPLLDDAAGDPSAVTRDYALELDQQGAPLLSIWGGKITTFRKLAEEAVDRLMPLLGENRPGWTETASLPGGDWAMRHGEADLGFGRFLASIQAANPWLEATVAHRWVRAYGSRVQQLLAGARSRQDLGDEVAPGLYEVELNYLMRTEWALTADDVLWRRSKLGLHLNEAQCHAVARWMADQRPSPTVQASSLGVLA